MATQFHQLEVKDIRKETADCISVSFIIPPQLKETFAFTHGQNITIKKIIDGEELRRSYSICSSPLDNELRIAVKKVTGGKFSAWASNHLKKGSVLEILSPTGKFYTDLNAASKKNYLAFAAGSGITPLLSIIKTTLLTEPGSHFMLVYGNKSRASIIFKEELEALKNKFISRFNVVHILSREKAETPLNDGRIDAEKCGKIFQHLIDIKNCDEFFLCGPGEMIFCVKDFLEEKGIDKKKMHFELFTVPGQRMAAVNSFEPAVGKNAETKTSEVTIKSNGVSFNFNLSYYGETILNAGLRLGADLPFACKGGVCATCRAKLLAGQVSMDNNYALQSDEIQNGYILTCQSHPRSPVVSIDYDHM